MYIPGRIEYLENCNHVILRPPGTTPGSVRERGHHLAGDIYLAGPVDRCGRPIRVIIRATDVALALDRPRDLSIRTVLSATVASIGQDSGPLAAVRLALRGGGHLTALATRKALDELRIAAGTQVFALVKTAALDERPIMGVIPNPAAISPLDDDRRSR